MADFKAFHYDETDSTNEAAKRLLAAGEIERPAYILARAQTAGRGTQGRCWVSPPGAGIYLTLVHPASHLADAPVTPLLTLAAGVACAEAILAYTGLAIQLKPVNDLYVEGRKLGGILTESLVQQGVFKALMTGVGINLRDVPREFSGADARGIEPASLETQLPPHQFERLFVPALVESLVSEIHAQQHQVLQGNAQAVIERYRALQLPGTVLDLSAYL